MTLKIALNGVKKRLKDYLILFTGLIISASIFYMFQSIATNTAFLKTQTLVKVQSTIYTSYIGSALLGLIILIYVFYANSFLLTMRQRPYAMYMMLGGKSRKIAQLIFLETMFIGFISVAIGEILGIGLSQVTSQWVINSLDLKIHHFSAFNFKAMFITAVFFIIIFAIAAIFNAGKLVSRPIHNLMNQPETPRRISKSKILWFIEILCGFVLLAVGYWIMGKLKKPPFEGVINNVCGPSSNIYFNCFWNLFFF